MPRYSGSAARAIAKSRTGIEGLDDITGGGLPRGRPTLVCGSAGCGKTLLAMQFLVNGAIRFGEPGVFMAFEETEPELVANTRSLGFDLGHLKRRKRVFVDHVHVERSEIDETGEYDLGGLFVRLGHAIDSIGARRVVLDTVESLFGGFTDQAILRAELRRLFRWLKDRSVTAIITGERGEGQLTRQGLEEYVSDCVILLDHRVDDQRSTRRLRIVKYRGTTHGTNEYPFLIDENGIEVMPITALRLEHRAPTGRISTGVEALDRMLGGGGYFRGSSVLVSGTAGTGKTSLAAQFTEAACRRGERCLYFSFEESSDQLQRNLRSIGVSLAPHVARGRLLIHSVRPTMHGLEMHLATMLKAIREFEPRVVVVDPLTSIAASTFGEAGMLATRLVDFLKQAGITGLYTTLTSAAGPESQTEVGISSLMDSWLLLRELESNGERNRGLYIMKSRGMAHSNQIREYVLTRHGIRLRDVYVGPEGVLAGSSRLSQEAQERSSAKALRLDIESQTRELLRKRRMMQAQVETLRAEFAAEADELQRRIAAAKDREEQLGRNRSAMAASRDGLNPAPRGPGGRARAGRRRRPRAEATP
jgi:circadian clock protein KaiC